ncbi:MAG: UDP-N-acetylmuramate--L-alanine ligase [Bacillaceae bacterium]|nr:UDP-N-acetylmuramate--L-alanine ligase [Bacillaceae bacterium]
MNTFKQEKGGPEKTEHVHFIGIGGYGMSAIARVMLDMGYHITGSDMTRKELTDKLEARGATVFIGHSPEHVKGADIVVYSTDIPEDNVERKAAEENSIPLVHRSRMLARLLNEKKGIAVSGAHGKTTTSSMIALVMERAGADPTYLIGGEIMDVGSNARSGKGDYVVAEADESDGSFLQYHPYMAVITNIEPDHLENYDGSFENLKNAYRKFMQNLKEDGMAILCKDDPYVRELISENQNRNIITYAIDSEADYTAQNIKLGDRSVSFSLYQGENMLGQLNLSVPGRHNVYNALAAAIVCLKAGISFEQVRQHLPLFKGAKRRFQLMGQAKDILIIDDYAHHPTEIQATIEAARSTGRRILAVFQPQRYTRTFFLLDAFSRAFGAADQVIITDIYSPAGEKQIEGVSAENLVERIRQNSNPHTLYIPTKQEVHQYLAQHAQPGDLVLTMGAGDIWKVAKSLSDHFMKIK